ncbi:MAG: hypothetical protein KDK48_01790 [Chlamydiia bacterium]|nr:hypothetical protein [Chlamydiia bacterium]
MNKIGLTLASVPLSSQELTCEWGHAKERLPPKNSPFLTTLEHNFLDRHVRPLSPEELAEKFSPAESLFPGVTCILARIADIFHKRLVWFMEEIPQLKEYANNVRATREKEMSELIKRSNHLIRSHLCCISITYLLAKGAQLHSFLSKTAVKELSQHSELFPLQSLHFQYVHRNLNAIDWKSAESALPQIRPGSSCSLGKDLLVKTSSGRTFILVHGYEFGNDLSLVVDADTRTLFIRKAFNNPNVGMSWLEKASLYSGMHPLIHLLGGENVEVIMPHYSTSFESIKNKKFTAAELLIVFRALFEPLIAMHRDGIAHTNVDASIILVNFNDSGIIQSAALTGFSSTKDQTASFFETWIGLDKLHLFFTLYSILKDQGIHADFLGDYIDIAALEGAFRNYGFGNLRFKQEEILKKPNAPLSEVYAEVLRLFTRTEQLQLSPSMKGVAIEESEEKASDWTYMRRNVPKTPTSLYRAVVDGMTHAGYPRQGIPFLRSLNTNEIRTHFGTEPSFKTAIHLNIKGLPDEMRLRILSSDDPIEAYLRELEGGYLYPTPFEAVLLAKALDIRLIIHHIEGFEVDSMPNRKQCSIIHLDYDGTHFDLLMQVRTNQ